LADKIWDVVGQWESLARDTVGKQLIRAADSIGANLAEGCGRGSYRDNQRFVRIARGPLNETRHWLRRSFQRKLLSSEQIDELKVTLDSLPKRLNAYLRSIGKPGTAAKEHTSTEPSTNDQ
jgi:four helix bundle protein